MRAHSTTPPHDEEAWAERLPRALRKQTGAWFTPSWLVEEVLDACAPWLPKRFVVIDPACGAGGFLAAAEARWPRAELRGLELQRPAADECRRRVPRARVTEGDALGDGWTRLLRTLGGEFELWLGNPPYNGRSAALDKPELFERLQQLVRAPLPKGTSLRDDFAFFLLQAAHRLSGRPGALAFVTSATLLDSYLYAPVREELLGRLELRLARELPEGTFRGTKARTCFTVWTTARGGRPRFRPTGGDEAAFEPRAPALRLRPPSSAAAELDERWRAEGEPLDTMVPVSFPGLKTRFDELLVDVDAERLFERVADFVTTKRLREFASRWELPDRCWEKLSALKRSLPTGLSVERACVRAFHHWRGAGFDSSWCYLERALIPRGDHRFRGEFDPHLGEVKLVFNAHELPLAAAVLKRPGCVPAWRHTRFAPLMVPSRLREEGLGVAARMSAAERADLVPNLSQRASALGEPLAVFRRIAAFINSDDVQKIWAPAFGAAEKLQVLLLPEGEGAREGG